MMRHIHSGLMLLYDEFVANPDQIKSYKGHSPIIVMNNDSSFFYLLNPVSYEALIARNLSEPNKREQASTTAQFKDDIKDEVTFESLILRFISLEESRVKRGDLSAKALRNSIYRLDKYLIPTFGHLPVGNITTAMLESFVERLSGMGLSGVCINQYLIIVRKVLKLACSGDHLAALPIFPKVDGKSASRGAFNLVEYRQLLRTSWRMQGHQYRESPSQNLSTDGLDCRDLVMTREFYYLIGFMVNSFVRPSDIKLMQHKHVNILDKQQKYLRLDLPETKRHDKPIVTMRRAVTIYQYLFRDAQMRGEGALEDYVFLPKIKNRDYALRVMGFLFNWLLDITGMKIGPHGKGRTLYSLRHTSITFRLLYGQGIDMLTLARNARTSVDMIDKHYASTLSGEMNIALLQSKRR